MPDGMSFDLDGMREFQAAIDDIIAKADMAARRAVTDGGHLIERRAKQRAPVLTGTLRRSIHVDSVVPLGPGRWQSITGPSVIYARQREFGGTIRAKNAPYLKFKGSQGWAQVKSVYQKPQPYMHPAFDETISGIRELYKAIWREAFEV